jgi:hypothetical protein
MNEHYRKMVDQYKALIEQVGQRTEWVSKLEQGIIVSESYQDVADELLISGGDTTKLIESLLQKARFELDGDKRHLRTLTETMYRENGVCQEFGLANFKRLESLYPGFSITSDYRYVPHWEWNVVITAPWLDDKPEMPRIAYRTVLCRHYVFADGQEIWCGYEPSTDIMLIYRKR